MSDINSFKEKLQNLISKFEKDKTHYLSKGPSAEREKIEREIAITDEKIDEIVYGLYGVTEEERKVILCE